jgi:hypothetical protein
MAVRPAGIDSTANILSQSSCSRIYYYGECFTIVAWTGIELTSQTYVLQATRKSPPPYQPRLVLRRPNRIDYLPPLSDSQQRKAVQALGTKLHAFGSGDSYRYLLLTLSNNLSGGA